MRDTVPFCRAGSMTCSLREDLHLTGSNDHTTGRCLLAPSVSQRTGESHWEVWIGGATAKEEEASEAVLSLFDFSPFLAHTGIPWTHY